LDSLRINLAKYYKESYNLSEKSLTNDKIVVTPGGSSYALTLSFEMLLRNSKSEGEIIVLAPFFGPYTGMIKLGQGLPVYVDTKDDFEPDLDKIEAKINEKTRGILINSPNNPTGKVYSDITIENIIKVARKHKVAVISDEVYEKFVYNDHKQFVPLSHFFEENPDVLLISNTSPSKTYGMIGDRIGYIMSNSEEFIKDIAISLGYRFASAPYISQVALDSVF
jgi:aspartate/methionine/tyrosine aminotransferase